MPAGEGRRASRRPPFGCLLEWDNCSRSAALRSRIPFHTVGGRGRAAFPPAAPVTLTGQVSRGFREPTLSDRFYRGPVGRGFVEGNPELAPETSLQLDVVGRY
ncbi:MAG TPA: TonB-dependent receptor [Vicinamibacterales bacterium]|nr:TonB-dependent receptor [Vicinamibacterales bacterium]